MNAKHAIKEFARRFRREDGQSMIEMAIVLPVLLTLILGIFYFGQFLNYSNDETHLAAEGARWAAVNYDAPGSTTLQAYVLSTASPGLQTASTDVPTAAKVYAYYPSGSSGAVGQAVRVCVTATVHFIPFLGFTNQTITQTATMRLEQTATNWTPDTPPAACPTS